MENIIEIKNLDYIYENGYQALENISFTIPKNQFVAIIGQNGAGKSTLLKNITGLLKPSEGNILIDGKNTKKYSVSQIAKKIGHVLQNPDHQLFADTVEEEIAFGPQNLNLSEEEVNKRVEFALKTVGLKDKRDEFPPALSKGDRNKVVIASVVAMQSDIVILDEPTTGQDYKGCCQIMNIAQQLHQKGHTIIMVTHHMSLVAQYAERTIVLGNGEILTKGTTKEVFAKPELLKETYVVPPQITQLGNELVNDKKTYTSVPELGKIIGERL